MTPGLGRWFLRYNTESKTREKEAGASRHHQRLTDIIWNLHFCVSKDIIKKVKRQLNEWEKIRK